MQQNELLRCTLHVLERLDVPYALVGSYGSSIFGEPNGAAKGIYAISRAFCEYPDLAWIAMRSSVGPKNSAI